MINAADLLPADQNYYTFDGSLTIPPCKEGVKSFVPENSHRSLSRADRSVPKSYPDNARPVQPTNGREIHEKTMSIDRESVSSGE